MDSTIGVDAHKQMPMAVALDHWGKAVGQWRGPNSPAGWAELRQWANERSESRTWGTYGAWNYGRGVAQHLVAAAETVYEMNPRWTARRRGKARRSGTHDRLDAHAVAQLVREEGETLPRVRVDDATAVLDMLITERESAVTEVTRLRNHMHQLLLQIEPTYKDRLPALKTHAGLTAVEHYATVSTKPVDHARAAAIQRLAKRLRFVVQQASELAKQIRQLAQAQYQPLTTMCGVDFLTAGA